MKGPCYEEDQDMDMCTSDEQCDGDEKCCFNGCHRTCGEKQGKQPSFTWFTVFKHSVVFLRAYRTHWMINQQNSHRIICLHDKSFISLKYLVNGFVVNMIFYYFNFLLIS